MKRNNSVIPRSTDTEIKRETPPKDFRFRNEVAHASTMGRKPHERKSLYKDVYQFYENNEV